MPASRAHVFLRLPMVARLAALPAIVGVAGCDRLSGPVVDESVVIVHGPGGYHEMVGLKPLPFRTDILQAGGTPGGSYGCYGIEDCWRACPPPQMDGGTTGCSCRRMYEGNEEDSNDDYFVCTVTHYGPGEHPWEGGGGGCGGGTGDIDDEGGPLEVGGAGCTIVKCGDARDRLAKEYLSGVWGNWPCTKFKRDHAELIGVGANGYHQYHDGFGLIIPALPNGIATVESRFNISLEYTSGYRCPVQNRKIKNSGGNTSHHIFGHAVDFRTTTGWTDALKDSIHQWGSNKANATESINYAKADGYHNHLAWNWRFN